MNNKSVSDLVAAAMDAALKSDEHKSLFGTQYKYASDENDAKCAKCGSESCSCGDSSMAWDDNDARAKAKSSEESSSSSSSSDESSADDNDAKKKKMPPWLKDESSADDEDLANDGSSEDMQTSALDVAIDSLLTASGALDSAGLANGATLSLKLASLVVEAKKKMKEDKKSDSNSAKDKAAKEKAAKEKAKAKEMKDKQMAKDKADKEKAKAKAAKEKEAKEKAEKAAKEKAAKEKASQKKK